MKPEINTETAETVETGGDQAVVQERLVSRSFVAEQFARFRTHRERQHQIEQRRGGSFGIAVHDDDDAVEWRTHCREVEEARAFLENRKPIPECWGESSSANEKSPDAGATE